MPDRTAEPLAFDAANPAQKALRRVAATEPGSWFFAHTLDHLDRFVHRLTGGRRTAASVLAGLPMVMLTTRGAKSGRPRTVPLLGIPDSGDIAVIASNYGRHRHPAWYHNLRAHPDAEVTLGDRRRPVHATVAEGERRERIWDAAVRVHPGFAWYARRAAHRDIAVFVLTAREGPRGTSSPATTS